MIVARLLIDNGSTLDVCLTTTLKCLKVDMSLIQMSVMFTRAFDDKHREVQGKIKLMIEISLRSFMVNFQVIKKDSPDNMLLGRPRFHVAGAITSTLYQRLKFIFKN